MLLIESSTPIGEYTGDMEGRRNGALISMENGKAVAFAIFNLQARGEMFVTHNDPVYEGMIVGLSSKSGDLRNKCFKRKKTYKHENSRNR